MATVFITQLLAHQETVNKLGNINYINFLALRLIMGNISKCTFYVLSFPNKYD